MYVFIWYPKCSTCRKAEEWLNNNGIDFAVRDIKQMNPSEEELDSWQKKAAVPLKRFFNTSGQLYRQLGLNKKLEGMDRAEQLKVLATDGMLVRRPILLGDDVVLVGFREKEWEEALF